MKSNNILRVLRRAVTVAAVMSVAGMAPGAFAEGIIVKGSVKADVTNQATSGDAVVKLAPVVNEQSPAGRGPGTIGGGPPMGQEASAESAEGADWNCQAIGGGLEYCEPPDDTDNEVRTPATASFTGGEDVPHKAPDMMFDDAGCEAGSGSTGGGLMFGLLVLMSLGLLRRKDLGLVARTGQGLAGE